MSVAKVYLVGAGPGDPQLVSLRGAQLVQAADVVLYDYLVNPVIAHHGSQAELICLGRHGRGRIWSQDEVNHAMVDFAKQGRMVVRLKCGDPAIFGRLAEEANYLASHSIPFEIVPGVTAASAASAYAGTLLTSRQNASAVALITGHELDEKSCPLDYRALAEFPGTLVVYMGVTTAHHWVSQLLQHGKPPHTPVMLVRRCSFPDQQQQSCRLDEVPERLTPYGKFPPPVVAVIGEIVEQRCGIDWFNQCPLRNEAVLVTRPAHQRDDVATALLELGAEVLYQPAIEIQPAADRVAFTRSVRSAPEYAWIVFSSANGVQHFFKALHAEALDARHLGPCKLAAIGPATAAALQEFGVNADIVPNMYRAEALAEALVSEVRDSTILLIRASRGREVLADRLQAAARKVTQVVAYESLDVEVADAEIVERLAAGRIEWTTVTSSAIAKSLVKLFGDELRKTQLVSISPLTTATLSELGHVVAAEAERYDMQGVVEAIVNARASRKLR